MRGERQQIKKVFGHATTCTRPSERPSDDFGGSHDEAMLRVASREKLKKQQQRKQKKPTLLKQTTIADEDKYARVTSLLPRRYVYMLTPTEETRSAP